MRIRGTAYPVLLPTWRDPRLHLAGVIVTLQVLGQTAFDFRLSIAQILVSLLTCAVLETEAATVVVDQSKLEPSVVQFAPFEVMGGNHGADPGAIDRPVSAGPWRHLCTGGRQLRANPIRTPGLVRARRRLGGVPGG